MHAHQRARLRLLAKQAVLGKQPGDIVAGLDFLNYMEVTIFVVKCVVKCVVKATSSRSSTFYTTWR
jgi:hypothetical protein